MIQLQSELTQINMIKQKCKMTNKNKKDQKVFYENNFNQTMSNKTIYWNNTTVNCIKDMFCIVTKIRKIKFELVKYSKQFYCIYVQKNYNINTVQRICRYNK